MSRHNGFILQSWRVNIDVSPIVDRYAVANYVAKYALKSEPSRATYAEIPRHIIDTAQPQLILRLKRFKSFYRDPSRQETYPFKNGSTF